MFLLTTCCYLGRDPQLTAFLLLYVGWRLLLRSCIFGLVELELTRRRVKCCGGLELR
jgi:protein-S-isoprenylcysteine O-methyltransferase Ste14